MDDDRLGIGGNNPPLSEILIEETADLKGRANDLLAAAGRAVVNDEETEAKAITMVKLLKAHAKATDDAREARKAEYLSACKTVQDHFKAIEAPLLSEASRITSLIDVRVKARNAEILRAKLEAEAAAKKAAEEAEALAAQASESIDAEVAFVQAQDRAATLSAAAQAAPENKMRDSYGHVAYSKKRTVVTIEDLKKAVAHLLKVNPTSVRDFVQLEYDRLARAKVRDLPGARVEETTDTVIR